MSDNSISQELALSLATQWISENVVGGTIVYGDDPWEENGNLYYVAGQGGLGGANVLNNAPKVVVNLTSGDVGWSNYQPESEEEETQTDG